MISNVSAKDCFDRLLPLLWEKSDSVARGSPSPQGSPATSWASGDLAKLNPHFHCGLPFLRSHWCMIWDQNGSLSQPFSCMFSGSQSEGKESENQNFLTTCQVPERARYPLLPVKERCSFNKKTMSKCEGKQKSGGRSGSQAMSPSFPHHPMGKWKYPLNQ